MSHKQLHNGVKNSITKGLIGYAFRINASDQEMLAFKVLTVLHRDT